jgi:membrane protein DedA with SNARE-associated domain
MEPVTLAALIGLLFVKETGIPVPVPGDLLVIGAGVAAADDPVLGIGLLLVILVAGFAGGCLQFLLVRSSLRRIVMGLLVRIGVGRERLDALAIALQTRGARGVAVARATPGLRVGVIAASGLAALPMSVFVPGLIVGNTVFVGGHFALGYVLGPPALDVVAGASGLAIAVAAFVVLAAVGMVGWSFLRRRTLTAKSHGIPTPEQGTGVFASWADAACPACLAIALTSNARRVA